MKSVGGLLSIPDEYVASYDTRRNNGIVTSSAELLKTNPALAHNIGLVCVSTENEYMYVGNYMTMTDN